ncbi:hypothetical protein LT493_25955 [Streptomyces tricolor]|nr:hypothetical protein [Streptomyces tricolor]
MTDPITTGHGPVGVHHHQFLVTDPGGPVAGEETDAWHTGLVGITFCMSCNDTLRCGAYFLSWTTSLRPSAR